MDMGSQMILSNYHLRQHITKTTTGSKVVDKFKIIVGRKW
jgi:hypothetical protein